MPTIRKHRLGHWEASVQIDGRRIWVTGKTKAEVEAKLQPFLPSRALPAPITVGELLERWWQTGRQRWKPRTAVEYRRILDRFVLPSIGATPLRRLAPDRLQRLIDGVPGRRQRKLAHQTLHAAFATAVRWGWLPANPLDRVESPPYAPPPPVLWTVDDCRRFLEAATDWWGWPFCALLLDTGLRPGEAAALEWSDYDAPRGSLTVGKTLQRIAGAWVIVPPKTSAGRRTLTLGELGKEALRRQRLLTAERRLRVGNRWQESGHIFTGRDGRPLRPETVSHALRHLCARLGLPPITCHKLRHLSASLALHAGVPLPIISRRLGHSSVAITAGIYSHAVTGDALAAEAIGRVLKHR